MARGARSDAPWNPSRARGWAIYFLRPFQSFGSKNQAPIVHTAAMKTRVQVIFFSPYFQSEGICASSAAPEAVFVPHW
jgi:hypothetical protein